MSRVKVTNEDLVKQVMSVARKSPQLWQQLKSISQQQGDNTGISQFVHIIRVNLPHIQFGNSRWKDKASGKPGVKSLLAESIAKEEGSKLAKEDVVETESVDRPNTNSCELATTAADVSSMLPHSQAPAKTATLS